MKPVLLLLLLAVGAGSIAIGAWMAHRPQVLAERRLFPSDEAGGWDRLALYVGVDVYPSDSIKNLAAPLNDIEALRSLMRTHYGFTRDAVLTGRFATREGIGAALRELIVQTRKAKSRNVKPVVLLFYGGHGSLIADGDEPDEVARGFASDSTWVAFDSDRNASRDVRDDDIHRVFGELDRLGATVVYLTDSCHSGTSYRDAGDDIGVRGVTRRRLMRGPARSLFPDLPWRDAPKLASFSACHDAQLAQERRPADMDGRVMGCFTYSAINVLRSLKPEMTYSEFGAAVVERFRRDWPEEVTRHQQPRVHIVPELRDEPFLAPR